MNIKTITALSYVPEWRWLKDGDNSIWYENMKVYRQKRNGHWDGVVKNIARDLNK